MVRSYLATAAVLALAWHSVAAQCVAWQGWWPPGTEGILVITTMVTLNAYANVAPPHLSTDHHTTPRPYEATTKAYVLHQ